MMKREATMSWVAEEDEDEEAMVMMVTIVP